MSSSFYMTVILSKTGLQRWKIQLSRPIQCLTELSRTLLQVQLSTAKFYSLSDEGTVEVHEKLWCKASVLSDTNGAVPVKHWKVVGFDRSDICGRGAPAGKGLEFYFYSMFPWRFLGRIVQLSSNDLL